MKEEKRKGKQKEEKSVEERKKKEEGKRKARQKNEFYQVSKEQSRLALMVEMLGR